MSNERDDLRVELPVTGFRGKGIPSLWSLPTQQLQQHPLLLRHAVRTDGGKRLEQHYVGTRADNKQLRSRLLLLLLRI